MAHSSLSDVARMAGVSASIASLAMRTERCVATQTRARALDAARMLSYVPEQIAVASFDDMALAAVMNPQRPCRARSTGTCSTLSGVRTWWCARPPCTPPSHGAAATACGSASRCRVRRPGRQVPHAEGTLPGKGCRTGHVPADKSGLKGGERRSGVLPEPPARHAIASRRAIFQLAPWYPLKIVR